MNIQLFFLAAIIVVILSGIPSVYAENFERSISIGIELRGFTETSRFDKKSNSIQSSAFIKPELKWRSNNRQHRISAIGFGRVDGQNNERNHFDIREMYWSFSKGKLTTTIGINKFFWGVTESIHLVDVINQTDLVEDIDQEDKL